MKKTIYTILILFVIFSSCEEELPFDNTIVIDSVGSITNNSAIVYLTNLSFDENAPQNSYYQPDLYLDTRPYVQPVIEGNVQRFISDDFQVKQFKFYLTNLEANEKYYIVAVVPNHNSNEISFETLKK